MNTLSIVIPVYNSEHCIGDLVGQIEACLKDRYPFEIVLVNDGSRDRSLDVIMGLADIYDNVIAIGLSRNFGQHNAIMAGLGRATGDYVLTMDDDLQHPVAEIPNMVRELEKGYDVVYGQYKMKYHSLLRNLGSVANNLMAEWIIGKPRHMQFTSFRIMRSYIVWEILKYEAHYPYIDGLVLRVTGNIGTIDIEHMSRKSGKSGYTLKKLLRLWLNGFMNFSVKPLRLFIYLGFVFASVGFLMAVIVLIKKIFFSVPIEGWSSLMISTLLFSGVQLLSIGMVGEYVGRMFLILNKAPQFVVKVEKRSKNEGQMLRGRMEEISAIKKS